MSDSKGRINPNRGLLLKISKKLTREELNDMKFVCHDKIADGELEKITSVLELFKKISQLDDTGDDGMSFISDLLVEVGRKDLSNELLGISNDGQIPEKLNEEMKVLLEVEKMVAADWQRLGRHLGLENYTIAEIDADYKKVREKCAAVFDKWRKRYGFNLVALREALLAIGRKDVIDSIPALKGDATDKDTTVPVQTSDAHAGAEEDASSSKTSSEKSGASAAGDGTASFTTNSEQSATHSSVETSSTSVMRPSQKPSGFSSGKYNINIHPGSHVMVGDCGQMTIYANTKIDQNTLALMKQNAVNLGGQGGGGGGGASR